MKFKNLLLLFSYIIASTVTTLPAVASALDSQSGNVTETDIPSKWYNFGDLHAGDCHQTGGHLVFYPEGSFEFSATTWTDHTISGDVWHSNFIVYDANGATLFATSVYNSPTMWTGQSYSYNAAGQYVPQLYQAIASVTPFYSC